MLPFYTPWNHPKTLGFPIFPGPMKWEHWPVMGECLKKNVDDDDDEFFLWHGWLRKGV